MAAGSREHLMPGTFCAKNWSQPFPAPSGMLVSSSIFDSLARTLEGRTGLVVWWGGDSLLRMH